MKGRLVMVTKRYKYPRTPHLPWSPGYTEEDLRNSTSASFEGREIIITEKMDGECTTLYSDHVHARSIDSRFHPSRAWVKRLQGILTNDIPPGWRICGENMYARHSLAYESLESYFLVFAIWNENNQCLSWNETLEWVSLLQLSTVPVLYRGQWNTSMVQELSVDTQVMEGYVVRTAEAFQFDNFAHHFAKWVRSGHVQTDTHWMQQEVIPNGLKNKEVGDED